MSGSESDALLHENEPSSSLLYPDPWAEKAGEADKGTWW